MLLVALLLAGCARQDHASIGDLKIFAPWSRETPPTASVAAGYLSIRNQGQRDDRLLAVETATAQRVEIHQTRMDGGMMRMRLLADGLPIPAGQTVTLAPAGNADFGYPAMPVRINKPVRSLWLKPNVTY